MAKAGLIGRTLTLAAVLAASACAQPAPPAPPPRPAAPPPAYVPPPPPSPPVEPPREADTCGRAEHAGLVGRNRSEIPVFPQPARVRVACTSCPVTMDFNAARLNIFYNETSGVIEQVRCG